MTSTTLDQLDGVVGDFAYKAPCRVVSTTNIVLYGLQTIDGVALAAFDRVLVAGQSDTTLNGIYTASVTTWSLAPDFNSAQNVADGSQVFVTHGSLYPHTFWYVAAANPVKPQDPLSPSSIVITQQTLPGTFSGVTTGLIRQTNSANFFGAQALNKMADKLFFGGATVGDGLFPNVSKNWLSTYQSYYNGSDPSVTTSAIFLSDDRLDNGATEPFMAGTHTKISSITGKNGLAVQAYAVADSPVGGDFVWAFYGEGHATTSTSRAWGMECHVVNRTGSNGSVTPYFGSAPNQTIGLQITSGCGFTGAQMGSPTPSNASAGLVFTTGYGADTDKAFLAGIVFQGTSLDGTNGNDSGNGQAIMMAKGHRITWYVPGNTPGPFISSSIATASNSTNILFTDGGFTVNGPSGQVLLQIPTLASAVNRVTINAAATGGPPQLISSGSDTNIHLRLSPKGTGTLWLDVPEGTSATGGSATALPSQPVGYLKMLNSAGSTVKVAYYAN